MIARESQGHFVFLEAQETVRLVCVVILRGVARLGIVVERLHIDTVLRREFLFEANG
jgi:hypothetical protein